MCILFDQGTQVVVAGASFMSAEISQPVFTVGHSNLEFAKFAVLLKQHCIQAVGDVSSSPYSQYNPQFNQQPLQRALREQGISSRPSFPLMAFAGSPKNPRAFSRHGRSTRAVPTARRQA
jgi:hypothetical protein